MDSIKPSFDVMLQMGLHRGHYSRKKRRPQTHTSENLHEVIDTTGRGGYSHGSHTASMDDAGDKPRYSTDRQLRSPTIDKRRTHESEHNRASPWMTDFREVSPAERQLKPLHTAGHSRIDVGRSKVRGNTPESSLPLMVMRASRLSTDNVDEAAGFRPSSYATLPRSSHHHCRPSTAVISVEELPRPQRGTFLVRETEKTLGGADDEDQYAWNTVSSSGGWRLRQSNGPHVGYRPVSVQDDDLMAYVRNTESTPGDFTLNAILAGQGGSTHRVQRPLSTASTYTADDEIGQLHRLLDNPFTGPQHDGSQHQQQVLLHDYVCYL